ncbi:MAG: thioesterase family protein [Spongiibacteraceae bacterium]
MTSVTPVAGTAAGTSPTIPLIGYRDRVKPEWIDNNDHLNSMHYKTIADSATRALFKIGGLTADNLRATNNSAFQLEMHICFERELRLDDPFEVRSWLIGVDAKRLHHFHEIVQTTDNFRAATVELMTVFIDRNTRRTAPMPEAMQALFQQVVATRAGITLPDKVSRRIRMERDSDGKN